MKTIIAGSRGILNGAIIELAIISSELEITEVVSGGAKGVDRMGELWAEWNKIPIKKFIPDWSQGKVAGILRNREMADYADALVAVWDGQSRGTKNMIDEARKRNLHVHIYQTD